MKEIIFSSLVAAGVAFAVVSYSSASQNSNEMLTKELKTKFALLESKVDGIVERQKKSDEVNRGRLAQEGKDAQKQEAASKEYGELNRLILAGDYSAAKAKADHILKEYPKERIARRVRSIRQEIGVIGKDAPEDYKVDKWFQGEKDINASTDKAKLFVFWEVWCPHCKREMPGLEKNFKQYTDMGVELFAFTKVNRSATDASVQEFIKQNSLTYPIAKEDGSLSRHFAVSGVPAAAMVKGGKIVWRGHPARLSNELIKKLNM